MIGALFRRGAEAIGLSCPPAIVIDAPDYTYLHSGVRCLHVLCDRLNALGIGAAVTARVVDQRMRTPRIKRSMLRRLPSLLDGSVVIYPEVIDGNPLRAKRVVRYLLNKPGYFNARGTETYGADDFFIHFAEEFRPQGLKSMLLRLPLIDTSVFRPPPSGQQRSGFLVYCDRYRPDVDSFPDWVGPLTMISRETPRDPPTLADLYRRSQALIVGERTGATPEALHCHCPVIFLPHAAFVYKPLLSFFGGYGVALGFDRDALARATETAPQFAPHYAAQFEDVDRRILECVAEMERYFGMPRLRAAGVNA